MNNLKDNFVLKTDAYKQTHWMQYPKGTKTVFSYLESRGGEFPETLFFGLQYYLINYLEGVRVTQEMIEYAEEFNRKVFFGQEFTNRKGWEYIVNECGGKLPIRIKALPEGTVIPVSNALMTVENTGPEETAFLTNVIESLLLKVWYPTTVATLSFNIKKVAQKYADICGVELSPFFLNDFGYRGVSSEESAAIGGMAHLINFMGTDNLVAILCAMENYDSDVCGGSVMAAEHSTVTIYEKENEKQAYSNMLDACPTGIISIVSDSYDLYNAVDNIFGKELKEKILARDGKLVVRPDSGYPPEVALNVLNSLWENFGGTINEKGYKVLDPHVGVIYGDGIGLEMIDKILQKVVIEGKFSIENIVKGMGGALLQIVNRDTQKFAFKASAALVDGEWRDIYKQPKTDSGKNSKRGILEVYYNTDEKRFFTENEKYTPRENDIPQLVTVFENGNILKKYTFDEIKANVEKTKG